MFGRGICVFAVVWRFATYILLDCHMLFQLELEKGRHLGSFRTTHQGYWSTLLYDEFCYKMSIKLATLPHEY